MLRSAAEILTIGDELLKGSTLNTNARFLGRELTRLGFEVTHQSACRDVVPHIVSQVREALGRADLIILSGGLGPTPDDLTRDALAACFDTRLVFSKKQFSFIRGFYRRRRKPVPAIVRKEAMFPANAFPLFNRFGIALGFYIPLSGGKIIVVLPGVPYELENMFHKLVEPLIRKRFLSLKRKPFLVVKTVGLSEPRVMEKLKRDFFSEPFDFGIYPMIGEVALRLSADSAAVIARLKKKVSRRLTGYVYALDDTDLSETVGHLLEREKKTLTVVESCTGGLLAAELARIPGASRYFLGGLVAYHNRLKEQLGIAPELLTRYGAVSAPVALQMALSACSVFGSDYALAITGIAGPAGGSQQKPLGRVYLALSGPGGARVWEENFIGERRQIQERAVKKALEVLWRAVRR